MNFNNNWAMESNIKHITKYDQLNNVKTDEVFKLGKFTVRFRCVEYGSCDSCIFDRTGNCDDIPCEKSDRKDNTSVMFVDEIPKNQLNLFE